MFYNCSTLLLFPDIKISQKNVDVIKDKAPFDSLSSISYIPNTSDSIESFASDLSPPMYQSSIQIPTEIKDDKFKISNISDKESLCNQLSLLNTSHVERINDMFNGCKSLISLPDISNWDTSKVTNMSNIFRKCQSLKSLPDLSKWNTSKVEDLYGIFEECTNLNALPDLSKWDTSNVSSMNSIFLCCSSLLVLPDIS